MKQERFMISVAKDFSRYPAGRYLKDGDASGTAFREKLVTALENYEAVEVTFDDVAGFGSSFLEEAFGGLIREAKMTKDFLDDHLEIATNDPELEDYVALAKQFIEYAADSR